MFLIKGVGVREGLIKLGVTFYIGDLLWSMNEPSGGSFLNFTQILRVITEEDLKTVRKGRPGVILPLTQPFTKDILQFPLLTSTDVNIKNSFENSPKLCL